MHIDHRCRQQHGEHHCAIEHPVVASAQAHGQYGAMLRAHVESVEHLAHGKRQERHRDRMVVKAGYIVHIIVTERIGENCLRRN